MRLFVGIALTREVQEALESWLSVFRSTYSKLRWSEPKQWHVTVQFLGETEEARYACVVEELRGLRAHPVNIQLNQPGFFERAGVFYVSVQATPSLIELHNQTETALAACGFVPETRPYSPHITLARRKGRGFSHDLEELKKSLQKLPPMRLPSIEAKDFLLYQSFTDPGGSRYEVRERFPLM